MSKEKNQQTEHQDDALFTSLQRSKKRRKRRIWLTTIIIVAVVILALAITVLYLRNRVRTKFAANGAEVLSYAATTGSISTTVSGSGTLEDVDLEELTVPANVEVEEILVSANDKISAGEIIASIDLSSVLSAMAKVQGELDDFDKQLANAESDAVSTTIKSGISGRVKAIYAAEDDRVSDCMYQNHALLLLSADGYMSAELDAGSLSAGDNVTATRSDGSELKALVDSVAEGRAVLLLSDNGPEEGEQVSFRDENGASLGSAAISIHNPIRITGFAGTVSKVNVSVGDQVSPNTTLLTLTDTEYSANYDAILRQREEKEEELGELLSLYHDGALLSPITGSVSAVAEEDALDSTFEQVIVTISPDAQMRVTISVDETDILSLEPQQTVELTIASISEAPYEGYVSEINKTATSASGITTYSAEILLDKEEKMLPGMTADAVIRIQGVDDAILIPVDALHQTSASAYVYTAYDEETKEYGGMTEVTVGLSNSNFVEIREGLQEGDVVYYTERKKNNFFFGMGFDMGGFGGTSDFGGMGDFTMPSSGGNMPSRGGNMPSGGGDMPSGWGSRGGNGGSMPNRPSGG